MESIHQAYGPTRHIAVKKSTIGRRNGPRTVAEIDGACIG
jgi:hypothetical protein